VTAPEPVPPPFSSSWPIRLVETVGALALAPVRGARGWVEEIGRAVRVGAHGFLNLFLRPLRVRLTLEQVAFIGVQSLPIIVLTSTFTGAVFALQSYRAFDLIGAEALVGGTVGVAVCRELGPTLTGLLVSGRAGSAMAAEIGTMRVTEQIDALDAMAVDPMSYLVKPRLVAGMIALPLLTATFDFVGILGAYLVCRFMLFQSWPDFVVRLDQWLDWDDIWTGLFKAFVFGVLISVVSSYKGLYTSGGAQGVGRATTSAVVVSSVLILIANFFIAWALP
jgi:phospholipid/cholesterol/gamma-HCH transport system permease protein